MAGSANRVTSKRAGRRDVVSDRVTRWLTVAMVLMIGLFILLAAVVSFGIVRGEEFSPSTFRRRSFYFVRLPLVKLQITPVIRTNTTSALERDIAVRYLKKSSQDLPRWDLVFTDTGGSSVWKGDARILCNYLDQRDDNGELAWHKWSTDNPELAKLFWPAVAELAQLRLYYFVPDLILQVTSSRDADHFEQQLANEDPMNSVRTLEPKTAP